MRPKTQGGFTITELIIAVAVASIIAAILFGSYRLGFLREAALSSDARSLVTALNYARVRGLEDKSYARIAQVSLEQEVPNTGSQAGTKRYAKVQLELQGDTEAALDFLDGEFVTFAGLDMPPFSNLNDMSHRIHPISGDDFSPIQISTHPETWRVDAMVEFPMEYNPNADIPETDAYAPGAAFVKCLSRASQLVIRKQSTIDPTDPKFALPPFFVYHDNQVRIAMEPPQAGGAITDDSIVLSFDAMGYTTRAEGYRLWLMRAEDDPARALDETHRKTMQLKVVNVTPLGRSFLWKTMTKQEEEAYEGKEGL